MRLIVDVGVLEWGIMSGDRKINVLLYICVYFCGMVGKLKGVVLSSCSWG